MTLRMDEVLSDLSLQHGGRSLRVGNALLDGGGRFWLVDVRDGPTYRVTEDGCVRELRPYGRVAQEWEPEEARG